MVAVDRALTIAYVPLLCIPPQRRSSIAPASKENPAVPKRFADKVRVGV